MTFQQLDLNQYVETVRYGDQPGQYEGLPPSLELDTSFWAQAAKIDQPEKGVAVESSSAQNTQHDHGTEIVLSALAVVVILGGILSWLGKRPVPQRSSHLRLVRDDNPEPPHDPGPGSGPDDDPGTRNAA